MDDCYGPLRTDDDRRVAPLRTSIAAAREREDAAFVKLMGGPANREALEAVADRREPDFTNLPPGW